MIDQSQRVLGSEQADQDRADQPLNHEEQHGCLSVCVYAVSNIARRILGATFVSYPGMGHNLPEELWPDLVGRIADLAGLS